MMSNVNKRKIPAIILLINFLKTFDSISHSYIQNVLSILGFGNSIHNWIDKFFCNKDAAVLIKGTFTDIILHGQGIMQGDIVSPYIFVIAVEILLI